MAIENQETWLKKKGSKKKRDASKSYRREKKSGCDGKKRRVGYDKNIQSCHSGGETNQE
jgi:hypothetical protein